MDVVQITRNEGVDRSLGDGSHDGGDAGVGVGGEAIIVGDGLYIEMGDVQVWWWGTGGGFKIGET